MSVAKSWRIIRLINPEMCLECRFSHMAVVTDNAGQISQMIRCRRLDCDNWDTSNSVPAADVEDVLEDEG